MEPFSRLGVAVIERVSMKLVEEIFFTVDRIPDIVP